jgi:flagellar M-ring protein FliF
MEAVRRTGVQFLELYRTMSPSQRGTLIAVPLMILGAFYFLIGSGSSSSYAPLSWGKPFSLEERMYAEEALRNAGLIDFRAEGQLILVPKSQVDRYNAVLLADGSLPSQSMSELERQLEKGSGPFASTKELEARKEIALKDELRNVIRALPDVEDAHVMWARSTPRSRFGAGKAKVTATVGIQPRRGRELSLQLIHSLRTAVANAIPDLDPDGVTVLDQSKSKAHTAESDGSFDGKLLAWIKDHTRRYQEQIEGHLDYIPNVRVTVNVDLEKEKSAIEWSKTYGTKPVAQFMREYATEEQSSQQANRGEPGQVPNEPRSINSVAGGGKSRTYKESDSNVLNLVPETIEQKEYLSAMPKSVQVTVSVPETYYEKVALQRGLVQGETAEERSKSLKAAVDGGIRDDEIKKVEELVARLVPAGSPAEAITVKSYTPVETDGPELERSLADSVGQALSHWGGAVGLALFALWALWMLNKSMATIPSEPAAHMPITTPSSREEDEEDGEEDEPKPKEVTRRDMLQAAVRDNPEMAAAVLSRWIQTAK